MPLVWLSRAKGFRHVERVYGPDLMLASYEFSVKQAYRHFFYGGAEGVPEQLVVGTYSPPFRAVTPNEDIAHMIQEAGPDVVWVGLSTPKQEQ
jgi:N-acetylglucosaminyldiphosphoundecaprenol N-acetyl-beta-D-mannosaminyltransferase